MKTNHIALTSWQIDIETKQVILLPQAKNSIDNALDEF